jgi:hypothetical protein
LFVRIILLINFSFDTEALNKSIFGDPLYDPETDFINQFNDHCQPKINYGIQLLYTIGNNKLSITLTFTLKYFLSFRTLRFSSTNKSFNYI